MVEKIPKTLLLTGGIACGKTFVSNIFEELGANVIDTDLISKMLTSGASDNSKRILVEIHNRFGEKIFDHDNQLNRMALRQLIFNNSESRRLLEQILHPKIHDEVKANLVTQKKYNVVVVPVIHELSDYLQLSSFVLVVEVFEALQIQRLIARDMIDEELTMKIVSSQISRLERRKLANHIIINTNRQHVRRCIHKLHEMMNG